jgi:hypothetical protein
VRADDLFCTGCGERLATIEAPTAPTAGQHPRRAAPPGIAPTNRRLALTRAKRAVIVGVLLTAAMTSVALVAGLGAQSPPSPNVSVSAAGRISR